MGCDACDSCQGSALAKWRNNKPSKLGQTDVELVCNQSYSINLFKSVACLYVWFVPAWLTHRHTHTDCFLTSYTISSTSWAKNVQEAYLSQRDSASAAAVLVKCNWKTKFCGHNRSIFNHCDVIGLQSYRIRWINAVQGHSKSPMSVLIESPYAPFY